MNLLELKEYAKSFYGKRYEFGGKTPIGGIDCSGFVSEILKAAGILGNQEDLNAQGIYDLYRSLNVSVPDLGALVFYGSSDDSVSHVAFCLDKYTAIGADGGHSDTLTEEDAIIAHAFVKPRPINSASYRTDVVAIILPDYNF